MTTSATVRSRIAPDYPGAQSDRSQTFTISKLNAIDPFGDVEELPAAKKSRLFGKFDKLATELELVFTEIRFGGLDHVLE